MKTRNVISFQSKDYNRIYGFAIASRRMSEFFAHHRRGIQRYYDVRVARVLDLESDDDIAVSSPTRPPKRGFKRIGKKLTVCSDDEIEDVLPASRISDSSISRHRSILRMSPLRPPKTHVASVQKETPHTVQPALKVFNSSETPAYKSTSQKIVDTRTNAVAMVESSKPDLSTKFRDTVTQHPLVKTPAMDGNQHHNEAADAPVKPRGERTE